jgi:DNA replication ATP-dependent helicase Dna2
MFALASKVFCARDYTLLQGLPGTGKTCTLAFVARLLAAHGRRVLITSYTHAAVDNVVLKLMESGLASTHKATGLPPLVRVGQRSSCHLDVRPVMVSELARNLDRKTTANAESREDKNFANGGTVDDSELPSASSLRTVVSSASIVCISALSVPRSPLLAGETFDVVIVDEAGQIGQPAILGALMAADSFVLVGDHLQLPPLVNSEIAELGGEFFLTFDSSKLGIAQYFLTHFKGYGVSMLKRLAEQFPYSIAQLTYQYRSNEDICRISSEAVYGGKLKCGNEAVRRRRLYLPDFPKSLPRAVSKKVYHWLLGTINPNKSVVFVDTDNIKKSPESKPRPPSDPVLPKKEGIDPLEGTVGGRSGGSVVNETEAALVRYIVSGLIATGLTPSSIGVVCPFRAQVRASIVSSYPVPIRLLV